MKGIVISLFDVSGEMVKPWAEAGCDCHIFDIQNPSGRILVGAGSITSHRVDLAKSSDAIRIIEEMNLRTGRPILFMAAFPPCTHLAVSGARWFKGKGLRALEESVAFFATAVEVAEYFECPGFAENPMSTISTYWREPDYKFHPAQYQGYTPEWTSYTKETWLWAFGEFVMPPMSMEPDLFNEPDKTYIHHQPPGAERANIRSKTPPGFPQAVFEYNKPRENAA